MIKNDSPGSTVLVERQMLLNRVRGQLARRRSYKENPPLFRFITITRDIGALGDVVARELARHLNWQVFDREIVDFIAKDSRVRQDLVQELDERSQSLIHDTVERLLHMAQGISFGNQEYHEALLRTLAFLSARGEAILVGRGSAYALQGEPGLHLRFFASPEVRVERLAQRWNTTLDAARHRMEKIDAERRSFRQHHFHQHVDDLRFFSAIFNTDQLSVEQIVHAVLGIMNAPVECEIQSVEPAPRVSSDRPGPAASHPQ
jgi:cytidylate kinase